VDWYGDQSVTLNSLCGLFLNEINMARNKIDKKAGH